MSIDPTAYRAPAEKRAESRTLGDVEPWECLRVAVGVSTVWVMPWGVRPDTTLAYVQRGAQALETAHLAPGTLESLLEIGTASRAALLVSPAWPVIDGPTPARRLESDACAYEEPEVAP